MQIAFVLEEVGGGEIVHYTNTLLITAVCSELLNKTFFFKFNFYIQGLF